MGDSERRRRVAENPFYVLGLRPECTRAEVEREGQKLLSMLELGLADAGTYPTPVGPQQRTAELVREAMAQLRDPDRRLLHELWAQLDPTLEIPDDEIEDDGPAPFDALSALGWRHR